MNCSVYVLELFSLLLYLIAMKVRYSKFEKYAYVAAIFTHHMISHICIHAACVKFTLTNVLIHYYKNLFIP